MLDRVPGALLPFGFRVVLCSAERDPGGRSVGRTGWKETARDVGGRVPQLHGRLPYVAVHVGECERALLDVEDGDIGRCTGEERAGIEPEHGGGVAR